MKQLAEWMDVPKTTVLDSLKRLQIPPRAQGRPSSSNPPYGYHKVDGQLVEHAKERKIIQAIRKMYVEQGVAMNAIAKRLTQDGIPTKKGRARWHHEMVRSILKKERLI